jgi:predicted  nucleic acid-binding Zn-ribbon protein
MTAPAQESPFDALAKKIQEQNVNLTKVFEALRQALTIAETSINERSARILGQLEPITKMLEVNQTMARELGNGVNEAVKNFTEQQKQIEGLAAKILPPNKR